MLGNQTSRCQHNWRKSSFLSVLILCRFLCLNQVTSPVWVFILHIILLKRRNVRNECRVGHQGMMYDEREDVGNSTIWTIIVKFHSIRHPRTRVNKIWEIRWKVRFSSTWHMFSFLCNRRCFGFSFIYIVFFWVFALQNLPFMEFLDESIRKNKKKFGFFIK